MFKTFKDISYIKGGALRSAEDQKSKSTKKTRDDRRARRTHLQNFSGRMLVYISLHLKVKNLYINSSGLFYV